MFRLYSTIGPSRPHACRRRPGRWLPRGEKYYYLLIHDGREVLLHYRRFQGIRAVAIYQPADVRHLAGIVFPVPEVSVKRKGAANAAGQPVKHLAPVESDFFARLMGLVEHCALTMYDDGEKRQPGWIMIRTMGAAWQLEAKDPDSGNKLPVVAATLDDALILMDALLRSEDAPWEPDPWLQAKMKVKKK